MFVSNKKTGFILMLIITISILTSCGNDVEVLENFSAEEKVQPVELTFYLLGNEPADKDEVLREIEKKCELNVKLDFQWIQNNEEYFENVNTALASNRKLDAFACGSPTYLFDIYKATLGGKVKDLTKLLPEYAPTIYSHLSKDEINMLEMDDKITVVPSSVPSVKGASVFINKELADKYSIKNINTFEDYNEVLKKMYQTEKEYISGFFTDYDIALYFSFAYNYVILDPVHHLVYKWDDPEIKVMPLEQIPEFKDNISQLNEWFKIIDSSIPNSDEKFATWLNFTRASDEDGIKEVNGTKYYYYNLFNDRKMQRESGLNWNIDSALAFNVNSANVERALMFLDWVQSDKDNYNLVNYGIEGEHFSIDKDGSVKLKEAYETWRNNPFKNYRYETSDMVQVENYLRENTKYAPHEGFYPDYTNLEAELTNRDKLFDQYIRFKIRQGTYDITKTEEIIDKLRNEGTDKIVSEVQKQLDNWRKNNK